MSGWVKLFYMKFYDNYYFTHLSDIQIKINIVIFYRKKMKIYISHEGTSAALDRSTIYSWKLCFVCSLC